jgi:hypothetical protein
VPGTLDDFRGGGNKKMPARAKRDKPGPLRTMQAMPPDRTFRSRVDLGLVGLMGGGALLPLGAAAYLAWRGQSDGVVLLATWGTVMTALVAGLTVPVRYDCRAAGLHIRSGWLRWDVPYAAIRGAARSCRPLSAPAWSLRRVRIDLGDGGFILVSPPDRESFMDELAARCPHLVRTPSGLAARTSAP